MKFNKILEEIKEKKFNFKTCSSCGNAIIGKYNTCSSCGAKVKKKKDKKDEV